MPGMTAYAGFYEVCSPKAPFAFQGNQFSKKCFPLKIFISVLARTEKHKYCFIFSFNHIKI